MITVRVEFVDGRTEVFFDAKYVSTKDCWLTISDASGSTKWWIPAAQVIQVIEDPE